MSGTTVTRNAPTGANYVANVGKVVYESAANEVTLCTSPTAEIPFGIITKAQNVAAGSVTVCVAGRCEAAIGDAVTPGTHGLLACAADSKLDPAASGDYVIAKFAGQVAGADGQLQDVIVIGPNQLN